MRKRWIIGGTVLLVALGAAYTGYWFWLARTFEQNLALWTDQQRAMGYEIAYTKGERSGYPFSIKADLLNVTAAAPMDAAPWRFRAASMHLSLAPWQPLVLQVGDRLSPSQYRFQWTAAARQYDVTIESRGLAIELSPDGLPAAIEMYNQFASVSEGGRSVASIAQLSGHVGLANTTSDADSSVTFDLSACCVHFDLQEPFGFVETHDWRLAGSVMGQIPPEPLTRALSTWSNQGGYLAVSEFKATWEYETHIDVEGSVALDSNLQPVASMTATLSGYAALIRWLESIGAVSSAQATAATLALGASARRSDDPLLGWESRVPLTIQNGFISTGAIMLARMPPIQWR